MADGNGFTNKEILLRLEEKVDAVLEDHEQRLRAHTGRLTKLELNALIARIAIPLIGAAASGAIVWDAILR